MTYTEKSHKLALDASIAVLALLGTRPGDCEFIPLKPHAADDTMLADLTARWPGRGLRSVGIIGLCSAGPQCVLKEPLESHQVSALTDEFLAYVNAVGPEAAEIAELERMYALPDPR